MTTRLLLYGILVGAVFCIGCIMLLRWKRSQSNEYAILMLQKDILEEQAKQMQKLIRLTRDYQESITNQLETAKTDNSLADYVQTLGESAEQLSEIPEQQFCKNILIQTLLQHKQMECIRKQIDFRVAVTDLDDIAVPDIKLVGILYASHNA